MAVRKEWRLRLICCGRENGIKEFATWDAADFFRRCYTGGPAVNRPDGNGHDRAAILERNE